MNAHADMLDQVAVYALGSLPPAQAAATREHLRTCDECRAEYAALLPAVDALAASAESCTDGRNGPLASPLIKARIMKTVRAEAAPRPLRTGRRMMWPAYAVAAACVLLAMWATISNIMIQSDLRGERDQVAVLTAQLSAATKNAATQRQMLADLMSTDAQRFTVSDGEVVRRGERLYIAMHNMPMPPKGHVYQTWMQPMGSNTMMPGSTFMPDRGGVAIVHVGANATQVAAVAVSIEPDGGSKAPTSTPEFVCKLI